MSGRPLPADRRDRLEALLPFYLNGTLSGDELAEVEAWMETDADAMAALAEAELEFSAIQSSNEAIRPPSDALGRFNRALDIEAGAERSGRSLLQRLWQRVMSVPPAVAWVTAAAALLLVVVQAGVENFGAGPAGSDYHVAGVAPQAGETPFALVSFKPDAKLAEVAALLQKEGGSIESGPQANGLYRIAIQAGDDAAYDRVTKALSASPLVAQVIPGRRPGNGS